ncbi:MAG TPA: mannitol dehydrogenase family protein [Bauldia sp.]|nr:mannitol dehydrogenase family protein [Bauldia sp.]
MTATLSRTETLGSALLPRLPKSVRKPAYDRSALRIGMAHLGVGAFHRCHQAEFTDDALEARFDRWGVVGINIRPPRLADTLGPQDGLYTRLLRDGERTDARVIGSLVAVVDSQHSPEPALAVLASSDIDVVTLTVTEKGYCHRPATGEIDLAHPDIAHDLAHPSAPRSVPGMIAAALARRMRSHGRPVTFVSCDNIPANGAILEAVVRAVAERSGADLARWIDGNVAFPSTMVDRIVPATSPSDIAAVEAAFGYRDAAVVVGEPFRQWVVENRFAGRVPPWATAGAAFVDDVTPFELIKMRVLNAAQTSLAYLGVLAGHEHTFDDMSDPVLAGFVRRMLVEESLPTLPPVPGIDPLGYVERSFARLANTAIRHRNHQIATDGSRKIVQRILNPIRERLDRGEGVGRLTAVVAAWMVYLISASARFGARWRADDPFAGEAAAIAERVGRDSAALAAGFLADRSIFDPRLAAHPEFRNLVARHLDGLLSSDPVGYVGRLAGDDFGRKT